jgi:Thiol:disulfide interchange protein DsbD, N-terminal
MAAMYFVGASSTPRAAIRVRRALTGMLLGVWITAAAPAQAPTAASPLRKVAAAVAGDSLRAGATGHVTVTVTLSPEFHVNSHQPSQEYLIATSIETESSDGLQIGGWQYPEGENRRFAFSEEPIRVYEGSFKVEGEIKAPATLPPSRRNVRLFLKYQACTADRCYPPKKEPIALSVRVDPATGTAAPPAPSR